MPRPRNMHTVLPSERAVVRDQPLPVLPTREEIATHEFNLAVPRPAPFVLPGPVASVTGDRMARAFDYAKQDGMDPVALVTRVGLIDDYMDKARREQFDMAGVQKEVQDLIDLAVEQGWPTPVLDGSKIKWTNPEGGQLSTPNRVIGRGLNNIKTQLRRLGLDIPNPQKKKDPVPEEEPVATPVPVPDVVDLDAPPALQVVEDQPDDVQQAYAALGVLTSFVEKAQADGGEWPSLCESLEADLRERTAERDELKQMIDQIKTALTTSAPWEALPKVAHILGLAPDHRKD